MKWKDVLRRKFDWTDDEIADGRRRMGAMARTVMPAVRLDVIKEDPPDNRILECAVAAGADVIVTGDKDLLRLGPIRQHPYSERVGPARRGACAGPRKLDGSRCSRKNSSRFVRFINGFPALSYRVKRRSVELA
jgi:hypothetical protein